MRVEDLGDMEIVSLSSTHKEKHIDALEAKVDRLEEQVTSLKKQLKQATEKPKDFVSQEEHNKVLLVAQQYWDTLHPF